MQVVFQDSYSALDPMMTLTQIITEPLHIHGLMTPREQTRDWRSTGSSASGSTAASASATRMSSRAASGSASRSRGP